MCFNDQELENIFFGICLDDLNSLVKFSNLYLEKRTFNNISILLNPGNVPSLEPKDLYQKIVKEGRGGYCFEHNLLIHYGLQDLGIESFPKLSRVTYGRIGDFPLTHICLVVHLDDQQLLLDLGFGAYNFKGPLPLSGERISYGQHDFLVKSSSTYASVLTYRNNKAFSLYLIENSHPPMSNIKLSNFYASQSQDSKFTQDLIVSRHDSDGKIFIHNHVLSKVDKGRRSDNSIKDAAALKEILKNEFSMPITTQEAQVLFNKATKENL